MLLTSSVLVGGSSAAVAVVLAGELSLAAVYLLAAVATVGLTPYRAAHSALLPSLCRSTDELLASNLVRGAIESVSVLTGPLLAAGLVAAGRTWTVFAATAALAAVAGLLVWRLPYERPPRLIDDAPARLAAEVLDGFRSFRANRDARVLMAMAAVQTFVRGALSVFTVVLALDLLRLGESGVGVLQAAIGVGAVVGSVAASRLVGARQLASWFGVGIALWGIPICLIGAWPRHGWALLMLSLVGLANAVVDVALFTMIGRLVADEVLARVFGVFEAIVAVAVALGSAAAAAVAGWLGLRGAMVALGAVLPLVALACWARLARIDQLLAVRQTRLNVLQRVPMLRALPVPTIERLTRSVVVKELRPGQLVIRSGTIGSGFYIVERGSVEVVDGGRLIRRLGQGDGFGEISLLRAVRRTTSVRAGTGDQTTLYRFARRDFVRAVTGYCPAAAAAMTTIEGWMPHGSDMDAGLEEVNDQEGQDPRSP